MSARLVSRKPRPYASFVAVSISRVRLSGCAVRIFSDSKEVSYLTNLNHKPKRPCCQPPRDTPILGAGGWWTNPKALCRSARNEGSRVWADRVTFSSVVMNHGKDPFPQEC